MKFETTFRTLHKLMASVAYVLSTDVHTDLPIA